MVSQTSYKIIKIAWNFLFWNVDKFIWRGRDKINSILKNVRILDMDDPWYWYRLFRFRYTRHWTKLFYPTCVWNHHTLCYVGPFSENFQCFHSCIFFSTDTKIHRTKVWWPKWTLEYCLLTCFVLLLLYVLVLSFVERQTVHFWNILLQAPASILTPSGTKKFEVRLLAIIPAYTIMFLFSVSVQMIQINRRRIIQPKVIVSFVYELLKSLSSVKITFASLRRAGITFHCFPLSHRIFFFNSCKLLNLNNLTISLFFRVYWWNFNFSNHVTILSRISLQLFLLISYVQVWCCSWFSITTKVFLYRTGIPITFYQAALKKFTNLTFGLKKITPAKHFYLHRCPYFPNYDR